MSQKEVIQKCLMKHFSMGRPHLGVSFFHKIAEPIPFEFLFGDRAAKGYLMFTETNDLPIISFRATINPIFCPISKG